MGGNGRPVAVLALQGDYEAHARALAAHGRAAVEARAVADLEDVSGVVLPGGESTTMLTLMAGTGIEERIAALVAAGVPVFATCAGVILLAREVFNPPQRSLGVLDVAVERNGYGRQVDSTVADLHVVSRGELGAERLEGVFIRAPRIRSYGAAVEVLARRGADPVLVRQRNLLAATFHPELSPGSPVNALFARMVGGRA
ncbi:MAG: pyridoxal 5'-phosphate synthase glutaminase subunit PdxT [Acidobacteriota bacterium]